MRHPKGKSSQRTLKRFKEDLLPFSMYDSIEYWLPNGTLPKGPTLEKVRNFLTSFRIEFIQYVQHADEDQIPTMMKSCKERSSLLCDFCQGVNELLEQGYSLVPVTKDYKILESNYKVRFVKSLVGIDLDSDKKDVVLEVNITNNPRMYKLLYYPIEIALMDSSWRPQDIQMLTVIVQSMAYIFEAVEMTPQEIVDADNEFLESATEQDCWDESSELSKIMDQVSSDMKLKNPPLYISDFKEVRRAHDGYMYNRPWTIDDAWVSTSSSGCHVEVNGKKIPNIGILTSAFETDYSDPIDEDIKYKSLYADEPYPGTVQAVSTTIGVDKTSSRGRRFVHPNCNGRQDRGSYFENMDKHVLKNVIWCDTTFDEKEGPRFINEMAAKGDRCLICTDMKQSTDHISHQFLKKFWDIVYKPGVSDFLLRCHSGEGVMVKHRIDDSGRLITERVDYTQISGIKCGTRSNFAVGLTEPHNFILRCTMKALGWEDRDPRDLFRVHGDDNFMAPKIDEAEIFLAEYTKLAREAGFLVHPIEEKGMKYYPSDLLYRAEYNKQVWLRGRLVSRIPHRLFFRKVSTESKIAVILWLSQYKYLDNLSFIIEEILNKAMYGSIAHSIWNFLVDKKLFGLPSSLRLNLAPELDDDAKFKAALCVFDQSIRSGVYDAVFNNRQRLSDSALRKKVCEYTAFYEDDQLIAEALCWLEDHNVVYSKLHYILQRNSKFADELKTIFFEPYIWYNARLGFFSDEEKDLIRRCLPYYRLSGLEVTDDVINDLLSAAQILTRTQPHSIGKRISSSTNVIANIISKMSSFS